MQHYGFPQRENSYLTFGNRDPFNLQCDLPSVEEILEELSNIDLMSKSAKKGSVR